MYRIPYIVRLLLRLLIKFWIARTIDPWTWCTTSAKKCCLTLITSFYKHPDKDIDTIHEYDVGLTDDEQHVECEKG